MWTTIFSIDAGSLHRRPGSFSNKMGMVAPGKQCVIAFGKLRRFITESPTTHTVGAINGGINGTLLLTVVVEFVLIVATGDTKGVMDGAASAVIVGFVWAVLIATAETDGGGSTDGLGVGVRPPDLRPIAVFISIWRAFFCPAGDGRVPRDAEVSVGTVDGLGAEMEETGPGD